MTTPTTSKLTRRGLLGSAAALAAFLPLRALALTDAAARSLVDSLVAEINRVIAGGGSLPVMISSFEKIFARYADVAIIAQSTLGADARRVTPAQMSAFVEAFRGYIARKYVFNFLFL